MASNIRIEIIWERNKIANLAFYYDIDPADVLPDADDQAREASGSGLDASSLQALKDGEIFEYVVKSVNFKGMNMATATAYAENLYADRQDVALKTYNELYSASTYEGATWDGTNWSIP